MPLIALPNEAVLTMIKTLYHKSEKWHYCDCDYYFVSNGECYVLCQSISFWTQTKGVYVRLEISDDIGFYPGSSSIEYEMAFSDELSSLMAPKASCDIKKLWRIDSSIFGEEVKDYVPFAMNALGHIAKTAFACVDFIHHEEFLSTSRHELSFFSAELIRTAGKYEHIIAAFCAVLSNKLYTFHKLAEKCAKEQTYDD